MRYSINIPNFGDFADPRTVASLAAAAETAGWDGLFVWDHVVHVKRNRRVFGDPWMLLTAAALATSSIKLGTLVTPVPRRRPEQLARQVATLDALSGGRVVFGAGLGGPIDDEYGSFGESTDPVVLAERLDEGLGLLADYWTGEPVTHHGRHFHADDVELLPATVQRPRPPVWIAGYWPKRRPMRRAARWDGAAPLFESARHGYAPPVDEVRDLVGYLRAQRQEQLREREGEARPFEIVLGGVSPAEQGRARDLIGPLADAGATWWDERHIQDDQVDKLGPVLRRVEQGPPRIA
ncbi:LLM class flavin-dependent oxidoreductase [Streptomyces sp. DW26H14]|uniref:LLM class flavin-dependent oxidoreductase n=1 Tax=Streptomyces sp. DW26H14 TaxID=3435395 RepID=UPI00403DEE98